jgi:hypothetical protein
MPVGGRARQDVPAPLAGEVVVPHAGARTQRVEEPPSEAVSSMVTARNRRWYTAEIVAMYAPALQPNEADARRVDPAALDQEVDASEHVLVLRT